MKLLNALLVIAGFVVLSGCSITKLDQTATMVNFETAVKITQENDEYIDKDDTLSETQKIIKRLRNDEHRKFTAELAHAAGNPKEDINKLVPDAIKEEK